MEVVRLRTCEPRLQSPRFSKSFRSQSVSLFIIHKFMSRIVVLHRTSKVQRDVGRMAGDVGIAGRVRISLGLAASFHAVEEVADVICRRIAIDFFHGASGQQRG